MAGMDPGPLSNKYTKDTGSEFKVTKNPRSSFKDTKDPEPQPKETKDPGPQSKETKDPGPQSKDPWTPVSRESREALSLSLERRHVSAVYRRMAGRLSEGQHYRRWPRVEAFLASLPPGALVADVGCGNGKYLGTNSQTFTIGSDICVELAEIAHGLTVPNTDDKTSLHSMTVHHNDVTTSQQPAATVPCNDVMSSDHSITVPHNDVMANDRAVTVPHSDVMCSHRAVTVPHIDVISNGFAVTVPHNDVTTSHHAVTMPHNDVTSNGHSMPAPRSDVMVCDTLRLPYREGTFDAVVSVGVLHHLASTRRRLCAARELSRVLRPGGKLLLCVWALEQRHRQFGSQDVLIPWSSDKRPSAKSCTKPAEISRDRFSTYFNSSHQSSSASDIRNIPKSANNGVVQHKGSAQIRAMGGSEESKCAARSSAIQCRTPDLCNGLKSKHANGQVAREKKDGLLIRTDTHSSGGLRMFLNRGMHRLVGSLLDSSSSSSAFHSSSTLSATQESNHKHTNHFEDIKQPIHDHSASLSELDKFAVREFPQSSWPLGAKLEAEQMIRLGLNGDDPSFTEIRSAINESFFGATVKSDDELLELRNSRKSDADAPSFFIEDLRNAVAVEKSYLSNFSAICLDNEEWNVLEDSKLTRCGISSNYNSISCDSDTECSQQALLGNVSNQNVRSITMENDQILPNSREQKNILLERRRRSSSHTDNSSVTIVNSTMQNQFYADAPNSILGEERVCVDKLRDPMKDLSRDARDKSHDRREKKLCEHLEESSCNTNGNSHDHGEQSCDDMKLSSGDAGERGDACMRYYHVFREGELVNLIRDHVPSLHILHAYYDHANWCVVAERVNVWRL